MQTFIAILTAPNGDRSEYEVKAKTKAEARKKVGNLYRLDTPAPRYGFYSFSSQRLQWRESGA